jgi:hypothetical protein
MGPVAGFENDRLGRLPGVSGAQCFRQRWSLRPRDEYLDDPAIRRRAEPARRSQRRVERQPYDHLGGGNRGGLRWARVLPTSGVELLVACGYLEPARLSKWTLDCLDGRQMIVWGGGTGLSASASGGEYDPVLNAWGTTSDVNAPTQRREHVAVWTGSDMIVWSGRNGNTNLGVGGRYYTRRTRYDHPMQTEILRDASTQRPAVSNSGSGRTSTPMVGVTPATIARPVANNDQADKRQRMGPAMPVPTSCPIIRLLERTRAGTRPAWDREFHPPKDRDER